jgi:hypothetical protein
VARRAAEEHDLAVSAAAQYKYEVELLSAREKKYSLSARTEADPTLPMPIAAAALSPLPSASAAAATEAQLTAAAMAALEAEVASVEQQHAGPECFTTPLRGRGSTRQTQGGSPSASSVDSVEAAEAVLTATAAAELEAEVDAAAEALASPSASERRAHAYASPLPARSVRFDASPLELYGCTVAEAAGAHARREYMRVDMDSAFRATRRRAVAEVAVGDELGEAAAAALQKELHTVHGRIRQPGF